MMKPKVLISGPEGNAFYIMAVTRKVMAERGKTREEIDLEMVDAMSGDYEHLLKVCGEWVSLVL